MQRMTFVLILGFCVLSLAAGCTGRRRGSNSGGGGSRDSGTTVLGDGGSTGADGGAAGTDAGGPGSDAGGGCGSLTQCGADCVTLGTMDHCLDCFDACDFDQTCGASGCTGATGGPGESCADPQLIPPMGGSVSFSLVGAAADHGDCANGPDRAFIWTPNFSGFAQLDAGSADNNADVKMAIYTSPTCSGYLECDDDGGDSYSSRITFDAAFGTTYYIVVGSFSSTAPSDTITFTVAPAGP